MNSSWHCQQMSSVRLKVAWEQLSVHKPGSSMANISNDISMKTVSNMPIYTQPFIFRQALHTVYKIWSSTELLFTVKTLAAIYSFWTDSVPGVLGSGICDRMHVQFQGHYETVFLHAHHAWFSNTCCTLYLNVIFHGAKEFPLLVYM